MKKFTIILLLIAELSYAQVSGKVNGIISGYITESFGISNNLVINTPEILSVTWVNDFARITFDNNNNAIFYTEIWESVDGSTYNLAQTLPPGCDSIDYYTWQNATLLYKIRVKHGLKYSGFTAPVGIISPLVFQTDQTPLYQVIIDHFTITGLLKTIRIDWGDGSHDDFASGANDDITHDYAATGNYFISLSGHVDYLWFWEHRADFNIFGSIAKWKLPRNILTVHLMNHSFTGDVSDIVFPATLGIFHMQINQLTGSVTNWQIPTNQYEIRLSKNYDLAGSIDAWTLPLNNGKIYYYITLDNTKITGDPASLSLPSNLKVLSVFNNLMAGDWTGFVAPVDCGWLCLGDNTALVQTPNYTGDWTDFTLPTGFAASMAYKIDLTGYGFTGDLSGWSVPDVVTNIYMYLGKNDFTKLPRGEYKRMYIFNAEQNNCNTTEIDAFLAYLDGYFIGGVVPLVNCVYTLNGAGMGIPSAAGLISKASIEGKYTAQGKTITISVNS